MHAVHALYGRIQQAGLGQLVQDTQYAARPVHILHVVLLRIGRNLAQAGNLTGEAVNVFHVKIGAGLGRNGQKVQHRVGGAAHGNVQRHGVEERRAGGDGAGEDALIAVLIIFICVTYNELGGLAEEFRAIGVGGHHRPVSGKRKADGFRKAVHGIGGEHAGTASAAGTGGCLNFGHFCVALGRVGRLHHGVNQIQAVLAADAGLHGAAGDKDGGDVEAHGGHEHAGRHLVAVADADHGIGLVGVYHVLHAVCYDVPGGEGIEHPVVAHGYAVVHSDGVEFGGKAAQLLNLGLDQLTHFVQVGVARYKLSE